MKIKEMREKNNEAIELHQKLLEKIVEQQKIETSDISIKILQNGILIKVKSQITPRPIPRPLKDGYLLFISDAQAIKLSQMIGDLY